MERSVWAKMGRKRKSTAVESNEQKNLAKVKGYLERSRETGHGGRWTHKVQSEL